MLEFNRTFYKKNFQPLTHFFLKFLENVTILKSFDKEETKQFLFIKKPQTQSCALTHTTAASEKQNKIKNFKA
jgi:hypothetical protein